PSVSQNTQKRRIFARAVSGMASYENQWKTAEADLASSQSELGSATGYFEELKKQCLSPEAEAAKAEAHRQEASRLPGEEPDDKAVDGRAADGAPAMAESQEPACELADLETLYRHLWRLAPQDGFLSASDACSEEEFCHRLTRSLQGRFQLECPDCLLRGVWHALQFGSASDSERWLKVLFGPAASIDEEEASRARQPESQQDKAAEAESRAEFKAFSAESKTDMASKQSDAAHLEEKKELQAKALAQKQADLASSQSELGSATGYFEELKKQCLSPEAEAAKAEAHRQEVHSPCPNFSHSFKPAGCLGKSQMTRARARRSPPARPKPRQRERERQKQQMTHARRDRRRGNAKQIQRKRCW
ncbi:unnamed protein product, partial [Effrenium voratum]